MSPRWPIRKQLFRFHGWLGLTLGLPLFVICLSGSFAVTSPEIDWLIHPAMRVKPPADPRAEPLSWGTLLERVEQAYPTGTVWSLAAGSNRHSAYQASVGLSPTDDRLVFLDPFTGELQGQSTLFNVKSFFRIFHKQLYIVRGDYWPHGRVFVCAFSFVLLLSALTGLAVHKRWWRALIQLRLRHGRRVFWSDLHRMLGMWSLLLSLLFAVTGAWYLAQQVMEDLELREHDLFATVASETRARRPPVLAALPLDQLAARAGAAYPQLQIQAIWLNSDPASGVTFVGDGPAILDGELANQVHVDPYSGEVTLVQRAHELTLGPRLVSMVDPLHFGRFAGWASKVVWTAAGLALSFGILIGAYLWWLRSARRSPAFFRRSRGWTAATLVMNLGLAALATVSTVAFIGDQVEGPRQTRPAYPLGEQMVGPWRVEALRHGTGEQPDSSYSFRFLGGGDPNFRTAHAWIGDEEPPAEVRPLAPSVRSLWTELETAARADAGLWLRIEKWDGGLVQARFPVAPPEVGRAAPLVPPGAPQVPTGVRWVVAAFLLLIAVPICLWLLQVR